MDGTVNSCNVGICAPKSHKLDFTFQRNNPCQKVTILGGVCGNGVFLGLYFSQEKVNVGN